MYAGYQRFATLVVLFALVSNMLMVVGSVLLDRFADMPGASLLLASSLLWTLH
jgi:hypothetical protein